MKYLLVAFTIVILAENVLSLTGEEVNIISVTNECKPETSLYTGGEDGVDDRKLLLKEVAALSYSVGKKADTTSTQVASKVMYSVNLGIAVAGALKYTAKIAPALGVLGAVFGIITGEVFLNENTAAIEHLKKTMNAGFNTIRTDMDRKFNLLKFYVDASIQESEMRNLESELQVLSQSLLNCVHEREDNYTRECNRNAIRMILANEFRYTSVYFKDTVDEEFIMKNRELSLTLYRKYIIISTLAHVTALKMLRNRNIQTVVDPDDQDFERLKLETSLKEGLTQFESYATDLTDKITDALWNGLPFRARCKRTGGVTEGEKGFTLKVKLTSTQTKDCIFELDKNEIDGSLGKMCDELHRWYSIPKFSNQVFSKAEKYWDDTLIVPLFGETGVLTQIKTMAEMQEIDETITTILEAEYSKPKYAPKKVK